VGLALWLMGERAALARGAPGPWGSAVQRLCAQVPNTPLLWPDEERRRLLRGSPVLEEAEGRLKALRDEWASLGPALAGQPFTLTDFLESFAVVLARSVYLPSAQCFALVPALSGVGRASRGACTVDYDAEKGAVTMVAKRAHRAGEPLVLLDDRPNSERVLVAGEFEEGNPMDCVVFTVGLVAADSLYQLKEQILAAAGFGPEARFPVYADRMPLQLLAYCRLSRVQDSAQIARVSFTEDMVISDANEYEVLMLLLGECRDRLGAFEEDEEHDTVLLARGGLDARGQLALRQRVAEKRILRLTMDTVRRRLAPIRGIPTKGGGMQDPNADLTEIFDTIESLPQAPQQLLGSFLSWARGDHDPEFRKKPIRRPQGGAKKGRGTGP